MACHYPMTVWASKILNPTGKRSMVFNRKDAIDPDSPIIIPCRNCVACKLKKSAEWATRIVHETYSYDRSIFLTLTFNEEFLPKDCGLHYYFFQKFMKRLRKRYTPKCPFSKEFPVERKEWLRKNSIKFYMCGEYGTKNNRPHFHVILFNFFPKNYEFYKNSNGFPLFVSDDIQRLWSDPDSGRSYGYAPFGDVTFESAAYVARYTLKKLNGAASEAPCPFTGLSPYQRIDMTTGEVFDVSREFSRMSNRPGIGSNYWDQFSSEIRVNKRPIIAGKPRPMPEYYDKLYARDFPDEFLQVKKERKLMAETAAGQLYDKLRLYSEKHSKKFSLVFDLHHDTIVKHQELTLQRLPRNLN